MMKLRVKPWCIPIGLTLLFYRLFRFVFLLCYVPTTPMEPVLPQDSFIFEMWILDEELSWALLNRTNENSIIILLHLVSSR